MKAWIGVLLLGATGCTEEAMFIDWTDEPRALEWTEYTRIKNLDEARILKDGPSLAAESPLFPISPEARAVIEFGPPMRVLVEDGGLAFLAYVDESNTYDVVIETLRGGANPSQTGEAGVWFVAGTRVDSLFSNHTSEHVAYTGDGIELESWLPPETIEPFFEKDPEPLTPTQGESILLLDGAALLDAPDGDVFGSIDLESTGPIFIGIINEETEGYLARAIGPEIEGHQLIEIGEERSEVQIRAYVETADIHRVQQGQGFGFYGFGHSSQCGCSMMSFSPNVLKGTPVYDDLDGDVVGWVTMDRHFALDKVDSDWARAPISWYFNTGVVWIRMSEVVESPAPKYPAFIKRLGLQGKGLGLQGQGLGGSGPIGMLK